VRQLIKRIIKEETEQDLSPAIKELLESSVGSKYPKTICAFYVVAPWKRGPIGTYSDFEDYQIMVRVVGGVGSKRWPQTQFVYEERDAIVNDTWHTVNNFMGLNTDIFLRNVKSCEELMSESTIPNTIKRRTNKKTLEKYITDGEINYPTLCDDFEDGYEYADKVIDYAIDEFIYEIHDNIDDEDYYSDVMDYLRNLCRNEFGEELIRIYNETCIENTKEEEPIEEGLHDTSWENDEGDKVTLIDLLDATKDIPVKNISVNKLKSKLLTWDGNDKEIAKIEKANLKYPILIFVDDNNKFISIIDGHHRAQKAVKHKLKTIKAKIIPINSLPKNIKKVFSHLKKKGESLNESKMMDYLKQFLSGEVLDNYRKEKGRKEFQKMVDMVYKITAKDHPIEGMVGVLVGNIDKEMWGRNFNDDNSVGSRWDFKVILKPLFTKYNPNNERDYGVRVLEFQSEFSKNARGMGFESISPIQHEKITNYRVSFEWASRLDVTPID
jgi:hypothetical protein